jgi:hypothetical protein
MNKIAVLLIAASILATSCTWKDAASITANAAVSVAMIATGNPGPYNMHADLAGQAAGDLAESLFDCSNSTEGKRPGFPGHDASLAVLAPPRGLFH